MLIPAVSKINPSRWERVVKTRPGMSSSKGSNKMLPGLAIASKKTAAHRLKKRLREMVASD